MSVALREVADARLDLQKWMKERDYAGHEPYDLLNAPALRGAWARRQPFATIGIQIGKRVGGARLRALLRVPPSKNPKAFALVLAAVCELARNGEDTRSEAEYLKSELQRLRSSGEAEACWGYDWDFVSLRGARLPAFRPNCIATCFTASALLDMSEAFGDEEAKSLAWSAARFIVTRLPRSVETESEICWSYTPDGRTRIFNNSVLAGALLARIAAQGGPAEYGDLALRTMEYLARAQHADGAWAYGAGRMQGWIDHFHTGYNLGALAEFQRLTGDARYDTVLQRGLRFYLDNFFTADLAPKYFHDAVYPVDIHSCAQAVISLCDLAAHIPDWEERALAVARWTLANMRGDDGAFFYQRHRFTVNRTRYMRWGQAWMYRALVRLEHALTAHA
jgi:hypothetical protein